MVSLLKEPDIENSDETIGNILTKIDTSSTGFYQPLDLASIFKMIHEQFKNLTTTTDTNTFCRRVEKMIDNLNRIGILTLHKSHNMIQNIIYFASVAPQACQGVFTRDCIVSCFIESGDCSCSFDRKLTAHADVDQIMKRCLYDWN